MGLLYKGLSVWVQSRLDPCPNDTYIHTYNSNIQARRQRFLRQQYKTALAMLMNSV